MSGLYLFFEYKLKIFFGLLPLVSFKNRLTMKNPKIQHPLNTKKNHLKSLEFSSALFLDIAKSLEVSESGLGDAKFGEYDSKITMSQFTATAMLMPSSVMISAKYSHDMGPKVMAKEIKNIDTSIMKM